MPELNTEIYAKELYSRVGSATLLNRATIAGGDWEPQANMCHHNVTICCELKPEYTPVRGWLYFELPGASFVKFVAHSAVRTPDGELYDITPSNASQDYPFVDGGLSEDQYSELVDKNNTTKIHCNK